MRRLSPTCAFLLLLVSAASDLRPEDSKNFILAARRTGVAELIDPGTLTTVARIHFDFHVERLFASAEGSALYVDGLYVDGHSTGCCKHYRLDLRTLKLTEVRSYEGNHTQSSLVSADGRWRFEPKSFRGPALNIFDLVTGAVQELIPGGLPLTEEGCGGNWVAQGTWAGDHFYFYVACPNHPGFLWSVSPEASRLGTAVAVAPFGEEDGCKWRFPKLKMLVAAGNKLFLYEPFSTSATRGCQTPVQGGAWMIDPATGNFVDRIAGGFHFNVLVPDRSGSALYGVDPGDAAWRGPVQLVALGGQDYHFVKSRIFDPGVLQIAIAQLQQVPEGDVQVSSSTAEP
jgi:hypothetical protein